MAILFFRDVVELVWTETTTNEIGDSVENPTSRQVFANKKSIRQNEFYQAQAAGLKPEIMFEVRTAEYADERLLIFDGRSYKIIRTYDKNGEMTELICSGITGTNVKGDLILNSDTTLDSDSLMAGSKTR